ncbi:MAG: DUF6636 domain-containing protein [Actinomycetota bacterium]
MSWSVRGVAILGLLLVAVGCGGGSDDDADDAADQSTPSTTASSDASSSTSSLVASTVSASTNDTTGSTATTGSTTESSSTTANSTTSSSSTTTSVSTTTAPTTTEILVIEGGVHEFTSPSGNIACAMGEVLVSCWISEKNWTIDQPDGPDCEISDWGNAVDLTADGPGFPCYTDFGWNPSAPALAYGNAVELGSFRCDSAQTGVTCRHSSGSGFTVARAAVQLF